MRGRGSSRPSRRYWQLIDTEHRLSDLYNLVNVPQAVWIDEQGRIVRPPETAGSTDHFRRMDLKTRTMSPEDQAERLAARQAYLDAVRAWVTTGKHALPADAARAAPAQGDARDRRGARAVPPRRLAARPTAAPPRATGRWTRRAACIPNSWSMWRQAADLDEVGKASGPDFWKRVQALGDRPYYPPPKL